MTAMRVVMQHEESLGRQVDDVHEQNLGYDVTSLDLRSGELRLIEVKGLAAATGSVLLTPNERRVAEDRRDCYWLYVVTNCASAPRTPGADPRSGPVPVARGHEGPALLAGRERDNATDGGPRCTGGLWRRRHVMTTNSPDTVWRIAGRARSTPDSADTVCRIGSSPAAGNSPDAVWHIWSSDGTPPGKRQNGG